MLICASIVDITDHQILSMDCKSPTSLLLFLSLLYALFGTNVSCQDKEREALLLLRGDLNITLNKFSSWVGDDCCKWNGVGCDNGTGHVVSLDLGGRLAISSNLDVLDSSLLSLKHLNYLDLSSNKFQYSTIPESICSLKELNHLNISRSGLSGSITDQLGDLSRLHTLDLSHNSNLWLEDASWISKLTSLHYLDLSYVIIGTGSNWLQELNVLPSIAHIRLAGCFFGNFPLSLRHVNLTSLSVLDLSSTGMSSTTVFPSWLFQISNLQYLYLSNTMFHGLIPSSLSNLCKLHTLDLSSSSSMMDSNYLDEYAESFSGCVRNSLQELYLSSNFLRGNIPDWIGGLHNLKILDLSQNSLSGFVPYSLGRLSSLQHLDVSYNNLTGTVSESLGQLNELITLSLSHNSLAGVLTEHHFANLTRLKSVDLSSNSLVLNMSSNWIPPFQLSYISTSSCTLGPGFPFWLLTQETLTTLDLSSAGISTSIPNSSFGPKSLVALDLSNNNLSRGIPEWLCNLPQLQSLKLSNNKLSGELPLSFKTCRRLVTLDLSSNMFTGRIPAWLGELPSLSTLILASNNFAGDIPPELSYLNLKILDLSSNQLSGVIPRSFGNLSYLRDNSFLWTSIMNLSRNSLSGSIPEELTNLSGLNVLDLSNNHLTGQIPSKMDGLLHLQSLDLSSNSLSGEIPSTLTNLVYLGYMNLSYNDLSGRIPTRENSGTLTDANSYVGNIHLCGFPLNVNCTVDDEEESWKDNLFFWLITVAGYEVGFWSVVGVLLANARLRVRCFLFIDDLCSKIYVSTVLGFRRLKRKFARPTS